MQTAELVVLWSSLAVAVYAYVVYPLLFALASRFVRDAAAAPDLDGTRMFAWPKVGLLIAARREENVIIDRLRNASALNYPSDRLEIVVGCDGEGDLTALLARSFEDSRVKVVQLSERRGTAAVLDECVAKATGEILVFSDVNTMMRPDALRRLVRHFQQADVGAVCGKLLPIDPTTGRNLSGLFGKFETSLSRYEARLGALSQINSGIYAIRKSLYVPLQPSEPSGNLASEGQARKQHYRLVYDDTAIAVEETPPTIEAAFRDRIKHGTDERRMLQQLSSELGARPSFMVWISRFHKRLRQACPALLVAAFVSNACLSNQPFYLRFLLLHELFYLAALIGFVIAMGSRWSRLLRVPGRLITKRLRFPQSAWGSVPGRPLPVREPAQKQPAAKHAAR
ncbi:MAG TPA: glycosyltransferase [Planctomycetaceae bacterium]|jgi:hypothetical protein|nr:glycosyltransferase [Planctomycetaceae bacterium]